MQQALNSPPQKKNKWINQWKQYISLSVYMVKGKNKTQTHIKNQPEMYPIH